MSFEAQLAIEKKVSVAVLSHVMHRLNEFFDEYMPTDEKFAGLTPEQISTEFARWLSRKDAAL